MSIKLQHLFVIAVVTKVGLSGYGWYVSDPWVFGLALPLSVMALYIGLGMRRAKDDVSDEKFADSCYYLGFIFTITSIIFSLFDLPDIGAKMTDIAVRFGVAMVSTVVGLAVRVYLVSFRLDMSDAITSAEDGVIDATNRLKEQLTISLEKMQEFDSRVAEATTTTLANVANGVEQLTESYGLKLSDFFEELSKQNKDAFELALKDVRDSTNRLADSVDFYSSSLRTNLESIETKVALFADGVSKRLEETIFPDDFFATRLDGPVKRLGLSADKMAVHVAQVSVDVASSVEGIRVSLSRLRSRSDEIEDALNRVAVLAGTQEQLFLGAQKQVETLGVISSTLRAAQSDIGKVSDSVVSQTRALELQVVEQRGQSASLAASVTELSSLRASLSQTNVSIEAQQKHIADVVAGIGEQTSNVTALIGTLNGVLAGTNELAAAVPQVKQSVAAVTDELSGIERTLVVHSANSQAANRSLDDILDKLDIVVREVPHFKQVLASASDDRASIGVRLAEFESMTKDLLLRVSESLSTEAPPSTSEGEAGNASSVSVGTGIPLLGLPVTHRGVSG